jgi:predicted anti-sigma-YlaC factor YlaD
VTSLDEDLVCRELVELVTDYLEGVLAQPDRDRFEGHLRACDGCTSYLEQMRETIVLTGMLTEDQIPPEGRAELLHVFRAWRDGA